MTQAQEKAPTLGNAGAGNTEGVEQLHVNAHLNDVQPQTERALLSGLLVSPARVILNVAGDLEERDFFDERTRTIFRVILQEARALGGEGYVTPMAVVNALRATGDFTGTIPNLMLDITATGRPAPVPSMVSRLAMDMRANRLRRGLDTAGRELIAASGGSHADIRHALQHARHLEPLAIRAGVIVGGEAHV